MSSDRKDFKIKQIQCGGYTFTWKPNCWSLETSYSGERLQSYDLDKASKLLAIINKKSSKLHKILRGIK